MGQPVEHSLRGAALAVRLAGLIGQDDDGVDAALWTALLRWSGCSSTAHEAVLLFGDDVTGRARQLRGLDTAGPRATPALWKAISEGHCYVAQRLAERLSMPPSVVEAVADVYERWDGTGRPRGRSGSLISAAARVAVVAGDLDVLVRAAGPDAALQAVNDRSGTAYDPTVVSAAAEALPDWLALVEDGDVADAVLDLEPRRRAPLLTGQVGELLEVVADFADLKVPALAGHTRDVATLAAAAANGGEVPAGLVHAAGLVHDLGRAVVANPTWERPGPLSRAQGDAVRLHPWWTARCLDRVPGLATVARTAVLHHERLDASGYPRGLPATMQDGAARLLAAADVAAALRAARPHRAGLGDRLPDVLSQEVAAARLDSDAVRAVLAVTGQGSAAQARPAGLTDREVDVVRLAARGATNASAARRLGISPKTIGRHLENAYGKLGVDNRAALAYEALRLGLLSA